MKVQGKLDEFVVMLRDKKVMQREVPAAFFMAVDMIVYLWAVQNGRVLECSLGYYIQPLVVFAFGALIFREKLSWRHLVILSIVAVGIGLSARGFHGVPYVTIILAVDFAIYAAIKKSLSVDAIVSTSIEMVLMAAAALGYVLLFQRSSNVLSGTTATEHLLLMGCGVVTCVPMLFYSVAVRNLPMMTVGICQYLSPTLAIFCGMIMGESLTHEKLVSFLFIWIGVILFTANNIYQAKKKR